MKRINPKTGKHFKRLDTRDTDDKLFRKYETRCNKDTGHRNEHWSKPVLKECKIAFCDNTWLDFKDSKRKAYCDQHPKGRFKIDEEIEYGLKDCIRNELVADITGCQGKKIRLIKDENGNYPFDIRILRGRKVFWGHCRSCRSINNKHRNLKVNWGITPEQYHEQINKQNGVCAICQQPSKDKRWMAVDHDHQTGTLRGILCTNCNQALRDREKDGLNEIELLLRMIKYLQMADLANKGLIKDFVFSNKPNDDMGDYEGFLSEDEERRTK